MRGKVSIPFTNESGEVVYTSKPIFLNSLIAHDPELMEKIIYSEDEGFGEFKGIIVSERITEEMCDDFIHVITNLYDPILRKKHQDCRNPYGYIHFDPITIIHTKCVLRDIGLSTDIEVCTNGKYEVDAFFTACDHGVNSLHLVPYILFLLFPDKIDRTDNSEIEPLKLHPYYRIGKYIRDGCKYSDVDILKYIRLKYLSNEMDDLEGKYSGQYKEEIRTRIVSIKKVISEWNSQPLNIELHKKDKAIFFTLYGGLSLDSSYHELRYDTQRECEAILTEKVYERFQVYCAAHGLSYGAWLLYMKIVGISQAHKYADIWGSETYKKISVALGTEVSRNYKSEVSYMAQQSGICGYLPEPLLLFVGIVTKGNKHLISKDDHDKFKGGDIDAYIEHERLCVRELITALYVFGSSRFPAVLAIYRLLNV